MKISIEYAHIYTNSRIQEEHANSLEILSELRSQYQNDELSLVVLVDDYSFPDPSFSYDEFSSWLKGNSHAPDLMIRESSLIPLCDQVIGTIEEQKIQRSLTEYIKTNKYPCSLFIASWYLARLGYLESDLIPEDLHSDKLINILPESFKPFEEKGIEIIRSTPFSDAVDQVEYRFMPGRTIQ